MRWLICAAVLFGLASYARADDLDILRGSQSVGPATFTRWSGFYAGGQFSYSSGKADFTNASAPLIASSLAETSIESVVGPSTWPILGTASTATAGVGGFAGYNTQWQDLILGVETDYTHSPFTVTSPSSPILDRVSTVGSNLDSVSVEATGTMRITDYGSLRARAGWVLNSFLPYGFAGFALGRADYSVTSLVYGQQNISTAASPIIPCDPTVTSTCVDYSFANNAGRQGILLYGFSVGGGFDWALTANLFIRAEYEFIQFAEIGGITASISSARVGAGFKF